MQSSLRQTHRLWAPLVGGRAGGGGRGALPLLLSAGASPSDELEDDESESESELDESEPEELSESESDELSDEDESSARHIAICFSMRHMGTLSSSPLYHGHNYDSVSTSYDSVDYNVHTTTAHAWVGWPKLYLITSAPSSGQVALAASVQTLQEIQDASTPIQHHTGCIFQQWTHLRRRTRNHPSHYQQLAVQ